MKKKFTISMAADVVAAMQKIANERFGGNISAAIEEAAREKRDAASADFSKRFDFLRDVRGVLTRAGLAYETQPHSHSIDLVVPSLSIGIEIKSAFDPERIAASVSQMSFSIGRGLCKEIWIVLPDIISDQDKERWADIAESFQVAPVQIVFVSELAARLSERAAVAGVVLESSSEPPPATTEEAERRAIRAVRHGRKS